MKVLSTIIRQLGFLVLANDVARAISVMLNVGFAGDSKYKTSKRGAVVDADRGDYGSENSIGVSIMLIPSPQHL
jgi:hypothetical protein